MGEEAADKREKELKAPRVTDRINSSRSFGYSDEEPALPERRQPSPRPRRAAPSRSHAVPTAGAAASPGAPSGPTARPRRGRWELSALPSPPSPGTERGPARPARRRRLLPPRSAVQARAAPRRCRSPRHNSSLPPRQALLFLLPPTLQRRCPAPPAQLPRAGPQRGHGGPHRRPLTGLGLPGRRLPPQMCSPKGSALGGQRPRAARRGRAPPARGGGRGR